jgi:hypothetical protein
MKRQGTGLNIWSVSCGAALLVLATGLILFRAPASGPSHRTLASSIPPAPIELKHAGDRAANPLFRDETLLRDPTPLFLPTRWNAANDALPAAFQREPGSSFQNYPARLSFPEAELSLDLPPAIVVPTNPIQAFARNYTERPYLGFGELDQPLFALPRRSAFVRVVAAEDGQVMISQPLSDATPPADTSWQPLEFLLAIDSAGMVRPPVLTDSSRVAEVDRYFRGYLVQTMHIGENLPPGFYRVFIGP